MTTSERGDLARDLDNDAMSDDRDDIFDEPEEKPFCCSRCGCIIGEEVGYSDNFGDGPICDLCLPK
jgi:hypothetical protein